MPWHGSGAATYLHIPNEIIPKIEGFIQAIKRPARAEADITYIAPLLSDDVQADVVWSRLLEHVAAEAGEHGIQRLYLCITSDDPGCEVVSNSGYTPYIRETLFRLASIPQIDSSQETPPQIRPQREADSLALQRLFSRYSPPVVQKAEGMFTSNDDAPSPLALRLWWQPENIEGVVFEEQGEIIAAVHIQHGNSGHWLRLFGDPNAPEVMEALLDYSLKTLSRHRDHPVYCAIRPYQSRFGPLLRAQNFTPEQEITRFVKHTTSFIKRPALQRAHEAIEGSMPGLIPTDFSLEKPKK